MHGDAVAREMHLYAFASFGGYHPGGWRLADARPERGLTLEYYVEMAKLCESAKLDAIFFADTNAFGGLGTCPFDALTLISVLAGRTGRLGLVATCSTTFNEPYALARRFASLDQLSGGRVGWNIVTSYNANEMVNYGLEGLPAHAERYARAEEFLEVVTALWDSWDEDALVLDKGAGVFVDAERTRAIEHAGEHFRVRGPGTQPRSPQGWPVLVQAGSSEDGLRFAARHAEVVFTAQQSIESATSFREDLRERAARAGRDPHSIKVLPGLLPVMGATAAEARERAADLVAMIDLEAAARGIATFFGPDVDLSSYPPDEPLPREIIDDNEAHQSRARVLLDIAEREKLTLRQLIERSAISRGHHVVVGTPEAVADEMQRWFEAGAADGFIVQPPSLPRDLQVFTEEVVPLLVQRGIFRKDYGGATLREHLGLARPALGGHSRERHEQASGAPASPH